MTGLRILVVDDNEPLRYAVGRSLKHFGFAVIEAGTGEQALQLAAAERPDLILLDVNLPDVNGFEVARRLKQGDTTSAIPILQISASSIHPEDRVEGLASGADAYLVEPVEPGELVANIRALLRMRDAEAGLLRTTATLRAVVEASPLPIVVFDRDGLIGTWNPAAERTFGVPASEVVGRPAVGGPAAFLADPNVLGRLTLGETISRLELGTRRTDGTDVYLSVFAAPLPAPTAGYVAILEDVSARRRFERERANLLAREQDARREAEAANRLKDEFLATLSHELRTPLNAIMGWTSMLRQATLDQDGQARALEIIERNAKSQQQLISDILEVSRIIRGQLRLDLQPIDLVAVVRSAIESVGPTASAKRQRLRADLPEVPVLVSADRERLQQVFWNLLSNAVKYTPREGDIEAAIVASGGEVAVTVSDTGVGIAPEVLPHIFERFRQGDTGPTREYGGLGLGLAIVRHLSEAHGGHVRATSAGPGHGASFTVTLPALNGDQP